jgi:hypothetical protein
VFTGDIAERVSGICLAGKFGAVVVSIGGVAQFWAACASGVPEYDLAGGSGAGAGAIANFGQG